MTTTCPRFLRSRARAIRAVRLALSASLFGLAACSSTGRLIPDYELLPVPVSGERYVAGARWNTATGTPDSAEIVVDSVGEADGLSTLKSHDTSKAAVDLNVPIIKWIAGSLGISSERALRVELKQLKHRFVRDTSQVRSRTVLLETITAGSIDLTVDGSLSGGVAVSVDVLKAKLGGSGQLDVRAAASSTSNYEIKAERPLVVAIRVAEVEFLEPFSAAEPFDLSTAALGRVQPIAQGYRLTLLERDPVQKTARVRIQNPAFPGWPPQTIEFSQANESTWINPNSEVIAAGGDPRAKAADYVWDTITLEWNPELAASKAFVVRQYKSVRTVASGLKNTL